MSRPIFEPSLPRTDRKLGFSADQLFRRPAPTAGEATVPGVEWVFLTSSTNWNASLTDINFTFGSGSYDLGPPTFDINASDNLEINKDGAYDFHLYVINVANDGSGTVWTHVKVDWTKLAGPSGAGPHGWVTGGPYTWLKTTYWPSQPLSGNMGDPFLHTFSNWDAGDFAGTPFELGVQAVKYWDGVETAESTVVVRMLVTRLGDPFA